MESPFDKPRPTIALPSSLKEAIEAAAAPYPKPAGRKFEYGTAGVSRLHCLLPGRCRPVTNLLPAQFRMKA